jgi:hypothetical protein
VCEVDWKRYRRYVLLRERSTWRSRDGKIIVLVGSNDENYDVSFGAEDN